MATAEQISLRQIRYFVAICERGAISAAAEAMRVSQPAVGMQIKQLEILLGVALLDRTPRGVAPTNAGRIFLKHSKSILETLRSAREEIKQAADPTDVRATLGATTTSGRELIDPILLAARTHRREHRFSISFREGKSDELIELLRDGKVDAALGYEEARVSRFEVLPLYRDEFVLVGTPKTLMHRRGSVGFQAIGEFPLVISPAEKGSRRFLEALAAERSVRLNIDVEMSSVLLKQERLFQHGRCMIVPKARFLPEIEAGTLAALQFEPALFRTMKLFMRRDIAPPLREFLISAIGAAVSERLGNARLGWTRPEIRQQT